MDDKELKDLANCIRALSIDAVNQANSGHPGMPMGMADAATVLFSEFLKFDATAPDWPDRDRFVLSNGHGSMLIYSLLHLTGYPEMTLEQVRNFRQLGSITPGHPEHGEAPGVETTTGPLGQGVANGVGMAIAERRLAAEFGSDLVDHRTWVFAGDGCLMEGVGQEAISLAGCQNLGKLILVFDDNSITIDGGTELTRTEDVPAKFRACNWRVLEADGHDYSSVREAFAQACEPGDQPVMVNLRTVIGYGSPNKRGTSGVHGSPLGAEERELTCREIGWEHPPFEIPEGLREKWLRIGKRGEEARKAWEQRLSGLEEGVQREFRRRLDHELPPGFADRIREQADAWSAEMKDMPTRQANKHSLEILVKELPELLGGSADLTGPNMTQTEGMTELSAISPDGKYLLYGVREFAMCAMINGMSLHGGLCGYAGSFLTFTDYGRNAIRLAALMKLRAIFVMTHDSIGLGEDGPTHQPIEHLAALRAVPGLQVLRPADRVETLECWEIAVSSKVPSVIALSRQQVSQVRSEASAINMSAKGAYVLREPQGDPDISLLATGTEVEIAVSAAKMLERDGINAAVVSMPCWELFEQQDSDYRDKVLGEAPRVAIEAAGKFGWTRYVASEDNVVGMDGFGASAPAKDLYRHFGITDEALCAKAKSALGR